MASSAASALPSWIKADDRVDHDGGQQHAGIDPVTQRSGDHRAAENHVKQDVVELRQQAHQRASRLRGRQTVRTIQPEPCGGLGLAQASGCRLQPLLDLGRLQCVPVRLGLYAGVCTVGHRAPLVSERSRFDCQALSA